MMSEDELLYASRIIYPKKLRAREVISRSNSGHVYKFTSAKLGRLVHAESGNEYNWMHVLEADPSVIFYQEQPFEIQYINEDQKVRKRFPDFLVFRIDGSATVEEVKDADKANDPEFKKLFEIEKMIVRHHGYEFALRTKSEIESGSRLKNAIELKKHLKIAVQEEKKNDVLNALRLGERSEAALLNMVLGLTKTELMSLAAHGYLNFDLEQPLTPSTIFSSSKTIPAAIERQFKSLTRRILS